MPTSAVSSQRPATAHHAQPAAWMMAATKVYGTYGRDNAVVALDQVSTSFRRGELTAIMGPSGVRGTFVGLPGTVGGLQVLVTPPPPPVLGGIPTTAPPLKPYAVAA